jgi:hypothetical protein
MAERENSEQPRKEGRDLKRKRPETAREGEAASGFPEPSGKDPGDRSRDPTPHHALANPVDSPDESEWPDPYDQREDPLEPAEEGIGDEPHPPSGAGSTSSPHPSQDPEAEPWEGPKRDKLDE